METGRGWCGRQWLPGLCEQGSWEGVGDTGWQKRRRETGTLLGVSNVSKVLGMEQSVVMMVFRHPKMTALLKSRKKGPVPNLLGSKILHPSSGVCSGGVQDFH